MMEPLVDRHYLLARRGRKEPIAEEVIENALGVC
jgi:hypothetical protein